MPHWALCLVFFKITAKISFLLDALKTRSANGAYVMFLCVFSFFFFFSDFLYESIILCCGYPFELHRQVS